MSTLTIDTTFINSTSRHRRLASRRSTPRRALDTIAQRSSGATVGTTRSPRCSLVALEPKIDLLAAHATTLPSLVHPRDLNMPPRRPSRRTREKLVLVVADSSSKAANKWNIIQGTIERSCRSAIDRRLRPKGYDARSCRGVPLRYTSEVPPPTLVDRPAHPRLHREVCTLLRTFVRVRHQRCGIVRTAYVGASC